MVETPGQTSRDAIAAGALPLACYPGEIFSLTWDSLARSRAQWKWERLEALIADR